MISANGSIKTATGDAWRLVYDSDKVLALVNGTVNDQTSTIHIVEEYPTEADVTARITELGLEYTPPGE